LAKKKRAVGQNFKHSLVFRKIGGRAWEWKKRGEERGRKRTRTEDQRKGFPLKGGGRVKKAPGTILTRTIPLTNQKTPT